MTGCGCGGTFVVLLGAVLGLSILVAMQGIVINRLRGWVEIALARTMSRSGG